MLLGTGLRLDAMHANPNVQHDEAWSYATASGRLGAFEKAMQSGLSGRWVPASAWQYYWQSDSLGDLAHIGPDLATYDVHPPLYFYMLHLWLMLTGMHHWAGPALNLIFAVLTTLALYGLARALGFERLESSLVSLAWALSPAVVSISALTRQYDLVALATVLFVWGLARATAPSERRRWLDALWVAAAACAALMTHYQTILLLLGGVVFAVAVHLISRRAERRRPWAPAVAGIAAGVVFAALFTPGFTHAFGREGARIGGFTSKVFNEKLGSIGQTLGRAAGLPHTAASIVALLVLAALIIGLIVPRSRRAIVVAVRGARPGWWTVLFFLAVTAGGVCLQNLAFLSLPPLLTSRYLAMAWPFFAFLPLAAFGLWPRWRPALMAAFCLLVLLPATLATPLLFGSAQRAPLGRLQAASAILMDAVGPGELPRILWSVPGDTPVFAGTQTQVLADPKAWATHMGDNGYYAAFMGGGNDHRDRAQILGTLGQGYDVTRIFKSTTTNLYELRPRT
jgi:4-amino-4-deoxy-L-arabinose transferase-like glycosyltransferase